MKASDWEFRNRALIIGLIFAISFPLYAFDKENATAALANWSGTLFHIDPDPTARVLFGLAAFLVIVAAWLRTWASAYLQAEVVYAAQIKTAALVADGPYRRVRNPLYLANILMIVGIGSMMSRSGFVLATLAIVVFSYRLITREEAELERTQGEQYRRYRTAVPRLWPALSPRVAEASGKADWKNGFKAESWYWGLALATVVFVLTLKFSFFIIILGTSVAFLWWYSAVLAKKSTSKGASEKAAAPHG